MQLSTARKIASKGVVGPQEMSLYQAAKHQIRRDRKRRRANNKRNNQR